jgi:hypothetical protein
MTGPTQELQSLIDDVLVVYERLVVTDVEGQTLEMYLASCDLVRVAEELKSKTDKVLFGG